jgi:hypothetical protein
LIALIVGTVLALAALSFVLYPLFAGNPLTAVGPAEWKPERPSGTHNPALDALREIEFDRETGKLSDADYEALRSTYTRRAVEVMRAGDTLVCATCGPRPEEDAHFCSSCGAPLAH